MVATPVPTASQPEPLSALLAHGSDRATAFVTPEDGRTQDYAQVAEAVGTLAGRLAAAGVKRGDRVGMTLPNGPEFVLLLFAAAQLGAAAAPLNPAYTQSEFTFYLEDIAPRLLLVSGTGPQAAVAAAGPLNIPVIELAIGADGPPDLVIDGAPSRPRRPSTAAAPTTSPWCCTPAARPAAPSRSRSASATSPPRPGRSPRTMG
jgi:malonyl-CoA/methylmalonyl-CoA synthetase